MNEVVFVIAAPVATRIVDGKLCIHDFSIHHLISGLFVEQKALRSCIRFSFIFVQVDGQAIR